MRKRRVQRLRLEKPLDGHIGDKSVKILNISLRGALVESDSQYTVGSDVRFSPREDDSIVLEARVKRCEIERFEQSRAVYHIALHFPGAELESRSRLRQLLIDLLHEEVERWKRNAGDGAIIDSSEMLSPEDAEILAHAETGDHAHSVWHRYVDGKWQTTDVSSKLQPLDGFCVTSDIEPDELALLRESYEQSDEIGRQLIRLLASTVLSERS